MNNGMRYEDLFDNKDKIDAFDQLAALFYNCNFGVTPKTEIDLLMFNFYMNALIKKTQNYKNVIDYNMCSDYEISRQLGITQDKVRNLKLKKQARYRVEFNWQESLYSIKEFIRFDEDNKKIIIPVRDPNLNLEIRNFINRNGGYIEFESGKDFIRIRTEYFLMLIYETLEVEDKKKYEAYLKKKLNKANNQEDMFISFNKSDIIKDTVSLLSDGLGAFESFLNITNLPTSVLVKVFSCIVKKIVNE